MIREELRGEQAAEGNAGNIDFQANLALALQNMGLIDRATASWKIVSDLADKSKPRQTRTESANVPKQK